MIDFREIVLSDAQRCKEFFKLSQGMSCDHTFGNLYAWKDVFGYKIGFSEGYMFIRIGHDKYSYFLPIGKDDILSALQLIKDGTNDVLIYGVSESELNQLRDKGVLIKSCELYRDASDYIYNSYELIELSGKKYHSKRNFVSRFKSAYNWSYENIDNKNIEDCKRFCDVWFSKYTYEDVEKEQQAVSVSLDYFFELGLEGGLLRVDGKVVAFTAGEPISDKVFCVHIEKADTEYVGAYNALNQEFIRNNCSRYEFINREEDMGLEGLRKSKESYNPAMIFNKYNIVI